MHYAQACLVSLRCSPMQQVPTSYVLARYCQSVMLDMVEVSIFVAIQYLYNPFNVSISPYPVMGVWGGFCLIRIVIV